MTYDELLRLPQAQEQKEENPYQVRHEDGMYYVEFIRPRDGKAFRLAGHEWATQEEAERAAEGAFWRLQRAGWYD